ncbi:MAG: M23 family metallopeptidase [Firmicutes bacterium]|nr:M23 family metallopeptidase [Bacillota bacterium]
MRFFDKYRRGLSLVLAVMLFISLLTPAYAETSRASPAPERKYIKWVEFNAPASLMKNLIDLDVAAHGDPSAPQIRWIEALAYLAARCGGDFSKHKAAALNKLLDARKEGKTMAELTTDLKDYPYYLEAYTAVLGALVGEYEAETELAGRRIWEKKYGLRAYFPLAKGFDFSDYDDFGAGRSYGYRRKHLGHDLMALTGTPVIACESGVVEELGWNQYGGWRVGIRSFDGLRYWYYAHLRQNRPYAEGLERGDIVMAGDVIGYVGHTGYSAKENVNGVKESHLHWGLQLIFDPSQKDGENQIWIDLYALTRLLENRRSETIRDPETKERSRAFGYREEVPQNRFIPAPKEAGEA